jgi:hypothetical protein
MRNNQNHQRKKAKFQWLQGQSHTNADIGKLCDVELANTAATKKRGYLKRNINELQIYKKKTNILEIVYRHT